jgi:competence protein ComEC
LVGVVVGSGLGVSWWLLLVSLVPLPLAFYKPARKIAVWGSLSLLVLLTGLVLSPLDFVEADTETLAWYNDSGKVAIEAVIDERVETRDSTQHLLLETLQITSEGETRPVAGKLLVYTPRYPAYEYGDRLLLEGKPEEPPVFTDEITGEVVFDYAAYLANEEIYTVMVYPEIQLLSTDNGNVFLSGLYDLKDKLVLSLERVLPEPSSSLVSGIFLGERQKIPADIQESFSYTGAFHLLAISGLHLGIIANVAISIGRAAFGRKGYIYIYVALIIIWLYAIIAGSGAPVIRAAIMASIFLVAELFGRQKNTLPALALAAAIMVTVDPKIINSASFQMSFSAMVGIALFYPVFRRGGQKILTHLVGEKGSSRAFATIINDSLTVSLAATIFVLPLTLYYFGVFAPLGPVVTLLLIPAVTLIVAISAPVAVLGLVWPAGAMVPGWLCWACSSYMIAVTEWFSSIGMSYAENTYITGFWVAVYYIAIVIVYLAFKMRKRVKKNGSD